MKPDLKMEETKVPVPVSVVIQPKAERSSRRDCSSKKLVVGISVGIFAFLAVAGVTIGAYYLGAKTTSEIYKEAKVSINGIESTIKVSIHEENSYTAGGMSVVRDFKRGLETYRNGDVCFVAPLVPGLFAPPENVMPTLHDEQTTSDKVLEVVYVSTGEPVNPAVLSEAAQELCAGVAMHWAHFVVANVTSETSRKRRDNDCNGGSLPLSPLSIQIVLRAIRCRTKTDTAQIATGNVVSLVAVDQTTGASVSITQQSYMVVSQQLTTTEFEEELFYLSYPAFFG